jgi:hypothetical protein
MTLGCVLALFRKRMRAKHAKRTAEFAAAMNIDSRGAGSRAKLGSLFSRGPWIPKEDKVALSIAQLRNREEERHMAVLNKLGLSPGAPGSSHYAHSDMVRGGGSEVDTESLYSQVTGVPPPLPPPVPRKPVDMHNIVERKSSQSSQFSGTTVSREVLEAQRYTKSVEGMDELRPGPGSGNNGDSPWLVPARKRERPTTPPTSPMSMRNLNRKRC